MDVKKCCLFREGTLVRTRSVSRGTGDPPLAGRASPCARPGGPVRLRGVAASPHGMFRYGIAIERCENRPRNSMSPRGPTRFMKVESQS